MGSGGWGVEQKPLPVCERCGRVAEVVILTTTTTSVTGLHSPEVESVSRSTRRLLCGPCAVPAAFANSEGVRDVIDGRATAAIVSIHTER